MPGVCESKYDPSCEEAEKWLAIDTTVNPLQLRLRPGATDALKRFGNDTLSLAMVMGRARTGKSFLMNKIMDEPGFFRVRSGNVPCTVGVDVSPIASYEDHFGEGGRGGLVGAARRVAFLDVEGQGDQGISYDVVLAAPLLLVSKVVIFNWNGKMAKDEMLNKLGVLAEAAKKIKPDAKAAASSKDYKIFGHLHVVLRDQADVDGVQEMLFEEEDGPATDDALEARNKIRKIIRQSFASYRVWGLPAPVESSTRLEKGTFTEDDVLLAFQEAIDELRDVLAVQLREPHVLCGRRLGAADIAEFMEVLTASINAGNKDIVPQSLFQQMETRRLDAAANAAIQAFHAWEKTAQALMPMASAALAKKLDEQVDAGVDLIWGRLDGISDEKVAVAQERFREQVQKSKAALQLANDKHIGIKAGKAKQAALDALQQEQAKAKARTDLQQEAALSAAFEQTKAASLKAYDAAVAAFKDTAEVVNLRAEIVLQAQATWSAIQGYNNVLKAEAARKEEEEKKKKAEAEKKKAEEERQQAEAARKKAEQERDNALRTSVSAAGSCGGGFCGGGGGGFSGCGGGGSSYNVTGGSGGGGSSYSSAPSYSGPLYKQPAGTTNGRGTVSLGNGYTLDRNGRYHGPDGRFIKSPK